jgi:GAF domain-containing protein
MPNKKPKNLWHVWEDEMKSFKNFLKYPSPDTTIRHWQRYLLFVFMQELSKNVLNENETFDSIIGRIIEGLQIGCGFKRIRVYLVIKKDEDTKILFLYRTSKNHGPIKKDLILKVEKDIDDATDTLFYKKPIAVGDVNEIKLVHIEELQIKGPYAAIPLLVENTPYGLICADTASTETPLKSSHKINYLEYKEYFDTFARTIMAAIENRKIFEQQKELLKMRDYFLVMLEDAVKKAHNLNSVLIIIRDSCKNLIKNLSNTCLIIKEPFTNKHTTPSDKCSKKDKDCNRCFESNPLISVTFKSGKPQMLNKESTYPILFEKEVIGVLYLEGKETIVLDINEAKILDIIIKMAAILIMTARNYERMIKQSTTLYEAGQFTLKMKDFREWFHPVMEEVMDIISRENRHFHLVMVEEVEGETKLFIRETSDLFIEGKPPISFREKLLNKEIPKDTSLSGLVIKEKKSKIINDVEKNQKLREDDPNRLPIYLYGLDTKAEVAIPLIVRESSEKEKVIGILIIDSIIPNDFRTFDIKFHETIANYLAITIHNQQLYEERTRYQEKVYREDRRMALQIFMKSFFHDVVPSVQGIRSQINVMRLDGKEKWEENLEALDCEADNVLSRYEKLKKDFSGTHFDKSVIKSIRELIFNSLKTAEITRGLGVVPIKGNYKDTELTIECYPVFIEMAFRAIIYNAIKYSQKVEPEKRYLEIDVKQTVEDEKILISFENRAEEMIPQDKLEEIFKPFVRIAKMVKGEGLGLSLAAECIKKLHDGDIWAENIEKKSAVCFNISLPRTLKISTEYQNE